MKIKRKMSGPGNSSSTVALSGLNFSRCQLDFSARLDVAVHNGCLLGMSVLRYIPSAALSKLVRRHVEQQSFSSSARWDLRQEEKVASGDPCCGCRLSLTVTSSTQGHHHNGMLRPVFHTPLLSASRATPWLHCDTLITVVTAGGSKECCQQQTWW